MFLDIPWSRFRCLTHVGIFEVDIDLLPQEISQLSGLQTLHVERTRVSRLPAWLGVMGDLEEIIYLHEIG